MENLTDFVTGLIAGILLTVALLAAMGHYRIRKQRAGSHSVTVGESGHTGESVVVVKNGENVHGD